MVLIQSNSKEEFTSTNLQKIARSFEYLEPWNENNSYNVWIILTQWFGVPIHAWNPKFFKLVATKFVFLVKIDNGTLEKCTL